MVRAKHLLGNFQILLIQGDRLGGTACGPVGIGEVVP
jgi:hypothetical protein